MTHRFFPLTLEHKPDLPREQKRIIRNHGEVRPTRKSGRSGSATTKAINRVWVKGKDVPGLMISRSLGDTVAHTVGVIAIPGNPLISNPFIDVNTFKLNVERYEYTLVVGSDGMWHMVTAKLLEGLVKLTFSDSLLYERDLEES